MPPSALLLVVAMQVAPETPPEVPAAAAPQPSTPESPPPPPPVAPAAPARVWSAWMAPCVSSTAMAANVESAREHFARTLTSSGQVHWVRGPATPVGTEPQVLAANGAALNAEKAVCLIVQEAGGAQIVTLHLVDVAGARLEWSRLTTADANTGTLEAILQRIANELGAHLAATAPPVPPPPPPTPTPAPLPPPAPLTATAPAAPPPPAPAIAPATPPMAPVVEKTRFWTLKRGIGLTLLGVGAGTLPAALASLLLSGAGHIGGNQLVFTLPGQPPPRYFSPVFTWTWGDLVVAGVLFGIGAVLVTAGAVLMVLP